MKRIGLLAIVACMIACQPPKTAKETPRIAEKVEPECTDSNSSQSFGGGGVMWTCRGGKYVIDQEATTDLQKREKHRHDLYWALRSRPLSVKEMAEVKQYGISLVLDNGVSYRESEKIAEFNAALLQQFNIRLAAEAKSK